MTFPTYVNESVLTEEDRILFQVISLLLQYPDEALWRDVELKNAIKNCTMAAVKEPLQNFLNYGSRQKIEQLQALYVESFDFNEACTLYLTNVPKEEEQQRGLYLLELKEMYREAGLDSVTKELPDYLPMFLEFTAVGPEPLVIAFLRKYQSVVQRLAQVLSDEMNPYRFPVQSYVALVERILQRGGGEQ